MTERLCSFKPHLINYCFKVAILLPDTVILCISTILPYWVTKVTVSETKRSLKVELLMSWTVGSQSQVTMYECIDDRTLFITLDLSFIWLITDTGIDCRFFSVNHASISLILTHLVLWVTLLPSVPSTHHSHHPLPLQSFTPGLKPSFSANPSHRSLLPRDWLDVFRGLFTDISEHIRFYLLFSFSFFTF